MNIPESKAEQLRCIIMALWKQRLHSQQICQFNHDLDYHRGWFYFDQDPPFRDPELTAQARAMQASGAVGAWEHVRMSTVHHISK